MPEKQKNVVDDRPQQVTRRDDLKKSSEFMTVEKTRLILAKRPQQVQPEDNLRNEGDFYQPERTDTSGMWMLSS